MTDTQTTLGDEIELHDRDQASGDCARIVNATGHEREPETSITLIGGTDPALSPSIPRAALINLYTSHFLSTWNSRLFEFGAILFLASIYPGTLLPLSIYALARSSAAIVFVQLVGSWIDTGNRIVVLQRSIIGQRVAVAASCGIFWVLERRYHVAWDGSLERALFALVVLLACVEKLCSFMNLVAIERDWVVVITIGNEVARRTLNARMRRIDLICKLAGPLAISLIAIPSTLIAVWATLGMSLASVSIEYFCIQKVYKRFPALERSPTGPANHGRIIQMPIHAPERSLKSLIKTTSRRIIPISSLAYYFRHQACLPSFALSLLYFTVLSFSGQMVTYLVAVGFTSLYVGVARTISTVFELSATWIVPRLTKRIGVVRAGIWSIFWQMFWLAVGVSLFLRQFETARDKGIVAAVCLAVGVGLSRMGLWGYDLSAQNIIQDHVDMDHRGQFSTVEAALQNLFELLSYVTTIVFSRPEQFRWPVVISLAATYSAGGIYTYYVRRARGHLCHAPSCVAPWRPEKRQNDAEARATQSQAAT